MARKTKEEALETRQNILNAALDVFYLKGVRQSSLEDIAEAAGVTRGAVYWHFKNKVAVFSALNQQLHKTFMDGLTESHDEASKTDTNPLHALSEHCIDVLEEIATDTYKQKIITVFMLRCDYSGDMAIFQKMQNEQRNDALAIIENFFEKAVEQKFIPETTDTALISRACMSYIGGIFQEFLWDPDFIDLKKDARKMVNFFFQKMI